MGLNIFQDNSNIWLVGRNVCQSREPSYEGSFRIHFSNLLDLVRNNQLVDFAFVGGSIPADNDLLWERFDNLGVNLIKQERGQGTGREVAVDEIIQLQMANRVLDVAADTMVLLTGDGSGYNDGKGFIKQLERAHKHGWKIEVVSWDAGCNPRLRAFAEAHGSYRSIEPDYNKVTFINNYRWAQ